MKIEPRLSGQKVFNLANMREGLKLHGWRIHFVMNMCGMGDLVNYSAATKWVMENCPWIDGSVVAPRYAVPLMKDIHPRWPIHASEEFDQILEKGDGIICPDLKINGVTQNRQFLNVMGAHPLDVGFAYYANTNPPPPGSTLPILDYKKDRLPKELRAIKYAAFPTANVQASRRVEGRHLNPIIEYTKSLGIEPVFLGKKDMLGKGIAHASFPDDIRYDLGVDLRDKTTVKEAAAIMQHAEFTCGLDTGLLHLAALMKDSKIIFGYNITSVAHREPRRNHGRHVNVFLTDEELKCSGCQSKLKHVPKHTFDQCLYGDLKCVDLLFANDAEKFTRAIHEIVQ